MSSKRQERKEGGDRKERRSLFLLLPLLAVLAGCSEAFDPFVASDQTFALYGVLDARRDTQSVRVQPIAEAENTEGTVEARVTSTDLAAGETLVWQDSVVQLDDGTPGTVFFAPFRPLPGRSYRLEASRPADGASSSAEVRLPAEPPFTAAPPTMIGTIISQRLTIESVEPPSGVVVTYTVQPVGAAQPLRFAVSYEARPVRAGVGFDVLVSLARDAANILSRFEEGTEVALLGLELTYDLVDEAAAPVIGGIGQIGTVASFTDEWTLASELVRAIGFVDGQGGG